MTEADDGKTVRIHVGDIVDLTLAENASTGYRWAFESLDSKLLTAEEAGHGGASDAVGSGGKMRWKLKAIRAGSTEVRLKLSRHWEGDSSIQKRFAVTLNIREAGAQLPPPVARH